LCGIGVDLSDISQLEVCTWGSDLLLSSDSSGGVGVFTLLTPRVCFSILRWYIYRDDQDLMIQSLEFFSWIVRGDCCVGNLGCMAVRRRLLVQLVAVSCGNRSAKLFEDTALACGVLGVLVDGTRLVKVTTAASTILMVESRVDLDLALHVA
jgi:hypothetical protein